MVYVLIFGIVVLIISIVALCYEETRVDAYILGIIGAYLISGALMYSETTDNSPTAMDVYQGKTTLEYIYRDGVTVDSIVVFKNLKD